MLRIRHQPIAAAAAASSLQVRLFVANKQLASHRFEPVPSLFLLFSLRSTKTATTPNLIVSPTAAVSQRSVFVEEISDQ